MTKRRSPSLSYQQKLILLGTVPLILAVTAISLIVAYQSRQLAEREIATLEQTLIDAKKDELRNYVTQARNGFYFIYGSAPPDDENAKQQVKQILSAMIYGDEGSFFVYQYDGTNLVSPRDTQLINGNWSGLSDPEGTPVVDELIRIARSGAGYHSYLWPKPSTGEPARMITYVTSFPSWQWAVGTGVFIDDVIATVATSRAQVEARTRKTFLYIGGITLAALLTVFGSGLLLNIRERRLADTKLKALTQRVFDAQEEERGRVARELHDGISQTLVGIRYALDVTRRQLGLNKREVPKTLDQGIEGLASAIQEIRSISRDLRPGVLDDLGLGPALKTLTDDFTARTGMTCAFSTVVFRNRLDGDAKIALYRVAQEALTNIERHADASHVKMSLRGDRRGAVLTIEDNGQGLEEGRKRADASPRGGIGLRNMQERMEQLNGAFTVISSSQGTTLEARAPLSHMLPPEPDSRKTPQETEDVPS
ncbi:two-component system NarL family sensor kinase [Planktotalea frisia]|jgi:two-component system NarL family sensor kinase|uniref:histidine kinase n=1 Tax=Planktotalea frisia TaxID=696762 RepID=A0A1L9NX02_9RHOB|nr:cache domain-containing protein [Planktotalea frisia]OJI93771.1 oxygen sensor histidine kinase NreB [Planktotalea frisia]PZX28878.1 two-component system NarL family sensor kinase [Planktotalea frisia]